MRWRLNSGSHNGGSMNRPAFMSHQAATATRQWPLITQACASVPSPEHLLAMKAMAARRRDVGDLRLLVAKLGLTQPDEVVAVCARVFPDEQLPARALLILADLFEQTG